MKIFYYTWNENSAIDVVEVLGRMGHHVVKCQIPFGNYEEDAEFTFQLEKIFTEKYCDIFFSFDFFPLIAKSAEKLQKHYISWVYDMPHHTLYSPSVSSKYVYLFLFDKVQYYHMLQIKDENVFHMPLAVNTKRLQQYLGPLDSTVNYKQDISFVGSLYENNMYQKIQYLSEFLKGYLDGIMTAQMKVYGYHLIPELLEPAIVEQLNKFIVLNLDKQYLWSEKEVYTDMIDAEITHRERVAFLKMVSERFELKIYTGSVSDELPKDIFGGTVSYEKGMPEVFRQSKINLNITLRSIVSGIPLRALDIMGAGGFLLSNYQPELAEYFVDGEELVLFESLEDMLEKIAYYLEHEEKRKQIAMNGYRKVQELFSYDRKLQEILELGGI